MSRYCPDSNEFIFAIILDQLASIHNVTLARILCDNGDALDEIQGRAMQPVSEHNQKLSCSDHLNLPRVDLSLWKDYN